MVSAVVVVAYLVAVEWRAKIRTLGGFVYAFVVLTLAMATSFFYVGSAGPRPRAQLVLATDPRDSR